MAKIKYISPEEIDLKLNHLLKSLKLQNKITVDDIKNVIYHEADTKGSMQLINYFIPYAKKEQIDLLLTTIQDAWNYLPHKSLNNLSPHDMYTWYYETKGKGKKPVRSAPRYQSKKTSFYQLFEKDFPSETKVISMGKNYFGFTFSARHLECTEQYKKLSEEEITDYAHRIKDFEELIKLEPLLFPAISELAHLYFQTNQEKKTGTLFQSVLSAAEHLMPAEFDGNKHEIPWVIWENRPYLSFLDEYAGYIEVTKGALASIPHYEKIIALNPNDNQGIRMILSTLYLKTGQNETVIELAKEYPDDASPEIVMGKTLALLKLKKESEARKWLKTHIEYMQHVIKELLKPTHVKPADMLSDRVRAGGDDEAYLYWENQGNLWKATSGAMEFIKTIAENSMDDKPSIVDFSKQGGWIHRSSIMDLYISKHPIYQKQETLIFRVKVLDDKQTYQDIECISTHTFENLHGAIETAFAFEDEHLYEFFLDNRKWSNEANIISPDGEKHSGFELYADKVSLSRLRIVPKMKFLYVFDFGSESWFEIEFLGTGIKEPKTHYPKIIKKNLKIQRT